MKLFVIFAQRKCRYPGEYAPEALECIDENGDSDNPDYLIEKLAKHKADTGLESVVVVPLEFSEAALLKLLNPRAEPIPAKIVD